MSFRCALALLSVLCWAAAAAVAAAAVQLEAKETDAMLRESVGGDLADSFRDLTKQFPYLGDQQHAPRQLELMAERFSSAVKQARANAKTAAAASLPSPSSTGKRLPLLCVHFITYSPALMDHVAGNMKSSAGWCSHWALIFFSGDARLIRDFKEQHPSTVVLAELYQSKKPQQFVPKPLLYPLLSPLLPRYERVWLLDADVSLRGFRFAEHLALVRCLGALVSQPIIAGHDQSISVLNEDFWTDEIPGEWPDGFLFELKRGRPVAARYRFVEQQAPMFDSAFLAAFLARVVVPLGPAYEALAETDWGLDDLWCKAARSLGGGGGDGKSGTAAGLRCGIVISTPVQHLGARLLNASSNIPLKHSHSLVSHWRYHFAGFLARLVVRDAFPQWFGEADLSGQSLRAENYTSFLQNTQNTVLYKDSCAFKGGVQKALRHAD